MAVGVGASRGCSAAELLSLVDDALRRCGRGRADVLVVASVAAKSDEPGVLQAAAALGRPARFYPAATLAAVTVPTPSERVRRAVGTASVAEAAAIVAASPAGVVQPGRLLVRKRRGPAATCAVADAAG